MENWLIGARLAILLYCIIYSIRGDTGNRSIAILLLLLYISSVTVSYIFRIAVAKRIFRIVSIIILCVSAIVSEPRFILLSASDMLELASDFTDNWKVRLGFAFLPAIFCDSWLLAEYIVLSALVFLFYTGLSNNYKVIAALKMAIEKLRDRNEELAGRLNAVSEYEAQLRYLSQIEERNSLAQKIHDRVGHTIAGSIIQLEAAGFILEKDPGKAGEIVRNVTENLKEGMENIRSTLRAIKPVSEQLGINRLKAILEEFSINCAIRTSLSYVGNLGVITHLQWKIIIP